MLKYNVLSRSIFRTNIRFMDAAPVITSGVKHKRKIRIIGIVFNFFNNRHAGAGLFMQDNCFKTQLFNKPADLLLRFIISPMNNKNLSLISCHDLWLAW